MLIVGTYLISKDIVETLERKLDFTLNQKIKTEIKILENEFLNKFWPYIPQEINQVSVNCQDTSTSLEQQTKLSNLPVISLDRVYITNAEAYLEVTRQTNANTGKITLAPRPNTPPLEEQISQIAKQYNKIVLTDVGAFGGDTIIEIINKLSAAKISIAEVYLGFSTNEATTKIKQKVPKTSAIQTYNFYEWIELRDLFGIDGRQVQSNKTNATQKQYIPYWENLENWASIPTQNVQTVTTLCQNYYQETIRLLSAQNHDISKIGTQVPYNGGN